MLPQMMPLPWLLVFSLLFLVFFTFKMFLLSFKLSFFVNTCIFKFKFFSLCW